MARLIKLFMNKEKIVDHLNSSKYVSIRDVELYAETVAFDNTNSGLRIFILMLTAFLHDIGKTIVYHRHGMEGATIISEHTSVSWYRLKQIAKEYNLNAQLEREDLLFIADLIDYHDQFGTLATGESGYQRLIDIIEKIKRYTLKNISKKEQIAFSERCLFDLWLLNIADIMVSVNDKWILQKCWLELNASEEKISSFFNDTEKCKNLIHDLKISRQILDKLNNHRHSDFYIQISILAKQYSDRHVVERIRRLIFSTLYCVSNREKNKCITNKNDKLSNLCQLLDYFDENDSLSENTLDGIIVRSIQSIRDFVEFCNRFSWIGQMDYSLGFFQKLLHRVFNRINYELENTNDISNINTTSDQKQFCFRTKWIRDKNSESFGNDPNDIIDHNRLQCKLIVENYTMTVVTILDQLLFREESIVRVKNIEFNETRDRLTDEKIDIILSLSGIYNSRRTMHLILKTVFLY